jgi:hypothetical protein
MTLNDTFKDNQGSHKDPAEKNCAGRQFKIIALGRGGIYTSTVKCRRCGAEFEAIEKTLLTKS